VHDWYRDVVVVAVSLIAVSAFLFGAVALARARLASPAMIRKALHAAVGAWTLLVTPQFHLLGWALALPGAFVVLNASPKGRSLFRSIGQADTDSQATGLWVFPLGVALSYILFWEPGSRPAILAGLCALAFADPLAAIVGARFGQRRYRRFGHGRSLEGTLAFFVTAAIGAAIVASWHAGGTIPWRAGIGCGVVGAMVEAVTPSGWDNLTIPVVVAAAYQYLV